VSFVYLASPYTPHNGESIDERVTEACKAAASLMRSGLSVFSPIVHSHYVADHLTPEARLDHEFWMRQDLAILKSASQLYVLMLPGWRASKGVCREIAAARAVNIPVTYMDP